MDNYNIQPLRKAGVGQFLLGLLQVILNPQQGWKDAAKDNYNTRDLFTAGLVPFLIVVALTSLFSAFYYSTVGYVEAVIAGILNFTGYFVSVFICNYLLSWGMKKFVLPLRYNPAHSMTFVIYTIASMALMTLLNNVFPADLALLSFLPLYVLYIMWGGVDFMYVDDARKPHFMITAILTLFAPPYILAYCLSLFI